MIQIQMNATLTNAKGDVVLGASGNSLTLGEACIIALDAGLEIDAKEGLKPKLRRGAIIEKIITAQLNGGNIDLPSEDISLLKERVALVMTSAFLVRSICLRLDPVIGKE
jgi:hypothetical protein